MYTSAFAHVNAMSIKLLSVRRPPRRETGRYVFHSHEMMHIVCRLGLSGEVELENNHLNIALISITSSSDNQQTNGIRAEIMQDLFP